MYKGAHVANAWAFGLLVGRYLHHEGIVMGHILVVGVPSDWVLRSLTSEFGVPIMQTPEVKKALTSAMENIVAHHERRTQSLGTPTTSIWPITMPSRRR